MAPDPATVERFRREARRWLEGNAERRGGAGDWSDGVVDAGPDAERRHLDRCRAWQRTLHDGGWLLGWPEAYGGRPASGWQRQVFAEECAAFDVTTGFVGAGVALVGPALLEHGDEDQRATLLPPLLRGDDVWCQLFSEPGAGSDLASLSTRAVTDGDGFVVDGQKVWTSGAHLADRAILLARTDPDQPGRRGLTFLLADMTSPGMEVRPLRTITGAAHFNEVFLTGVRVARHDVLGEVNGGWAPARTVLRAEAAMIGTTADRVDRFAGLVELARATGRIDDRPVRQALARSMTAEWILARLTDAVRVDLAADRSPRHDGSLLKVLWSEGRRDRSELAGALLGPHLTADDGGAVVIGRWRTELLNRFWGSIGGGTDEIHRNRLAEKVLGLPTEPEVRPPPR